ncbi:hypothetical protein AHF37_07400 [Paragonimus kellicotti]|nr:hypothetical protein AHF37_07400 [Paragonimus kellicotti]
MKPETAAKLSAEYDRFGDSFTEEMEVDELKQFLLKLDPGSKSTGSDSGIDNDCLNSQRFSDRLLLADLRKNGADILDVTECTLETLDDTFPQFISSQSKTQNNPCTVFPSHVLILNNNISHEERLLERLRSHLVSMTQPSSSCTPCVVHRSWAVERVSNGTSCSEQQKQQ